MVALELQDPTLATPAFINATGNGLNGWRTLTYGQLANAFAQGIALQPFFGNINTDSADLTVAKDGGAKIIQYHGLADTLIPPQNSINYYTRVANLDGGFARDAGLRPAVPGRRDGPLLRASARSRERPA